MDRREAARSRYITAHHAARYLGISGGAFNRWVWRYKIPSYDESGTPQAGFKTGGRFFLREDLDKALAIYNHNIASTQGSRPTLSAANRADLEKLARRVEALFVQ